LQNVKTIVAMQQFKIRNAGKNLVFYGCGKGETSVHTIYKITVLRTPLSTGVAEEIVDIAAAAEAGEPPRDLVVAVPGSHSLAVEKEEHLGMAVARQQQPRRAVPVLAAESDMELRTELLLEAGHRTGWAQEQWHTQLGRNWHTQLGRDWHTVVT
jgi:hypothetical protein